MLGKERNDQEENKLIFNITYYPAFQNTKELQNLILEELQILLAHQKVFWKVPFVAFHDGKNLKDHLVRASLRILNQTLGSELCGKRNCPFINSSDSGSR